MLFAERPYFRFVKYLTISFVMSRVEFKSVDVIVGFSG